MKRKVNSNSRSKVSDGQESAITREELHLIIEASESRIQSQVQEEMLKLINSINMDMKRNFQTLSSTCTKLVDSKYNSIHDRRSYQQTNTSNEEEYVISIASINDAIALVFMDSSILQAMEHMHEMKNLR